MKIFSIALRALVLAAFVLAACSGGGGGGGGSGAPAGPRFAFVANTGDNSVSSYVVDSASGRLKWIGNVAAGRNPQSVVVDPSGRYAYVANFGDSTLSQY